IKDGNQEKLHGAIFDLANVAHQVEADFVALVFRNDVRESAHVAFGRIYGCYNAGAYVVVLEPSQGEMVFTAFHRSQPFIAEYSQSIQQLPVQRRFVNFGPVAEPEHAVDSAA